MFYVSTVYVSLAGYSAKIDDAPLSLINDVHFFFPNVYMGGHNGTSFKLFYQPRKKIISDHHGEYKMRASLSRAVLKPDFIKSQKLYKVNF